MRSSSVSHNPRVAKVMAFVKMAESVSINALLGSGKAR